LPQNDRRLSRLDDLCNEPRCIGGAHESNFVHGLIDLVQHAKPSSVIEIGSDHGISTEVFALLCNRVVAVDPWPDEEVYQRFQQRLSGYRNLETIRGESPSALDRFEAGSFDMCYIDGLHELDMVSKDIVACRRIVKRWVAGHDYGIVYAAVHPLVGGVMVFSDWSWLARA
jgi:SAM-dependent methyltransferase